MYWTILRIFGWVGIIAGLIIIAVLLVLAFIGYQFLKHMKEYYETR